MMILSSVILAVSIIIAAYIISKTLTDTVYLKNCISAYKTCLYNLVDRLNEEFPESTICIEDNDISVQVKGELKFYKKKD